MAKIIQIPKKHKANIRFIYIFLALWAIYAVIFGIVYFTKKKVTIYEVKPGSISENALYIGIIEREEETFISDADGKCCFLVSEGERLAVNDDVICVDNTGTDILSKYVNEYSKKDNVLSISDYSEIAKSITEFKKTYSGDNFTQMYGLGNNIDNTVELCLTRNSMEGLKEYTSLVSVNLDRLKTPKTGVVSFWYDDLEDKNFDELKFTDFPDKVIPMKEIKNYSDLSKGSTAFRIVTDQNWNLYIKLSDSDAKKLSGSDKLRVYFKKKNISLNADFEIINTKYGIYGKFSSNQLMAEFINDRYVEVEIDKNITEGLKIPKTALVTKKFHMVPKDITYEYNKQIVVSVRRKGDKGNYYDEIVNLNIVDEDDDYYYISDRNFKSGDLINTRITSKDYTENYYTLSDTKEIQGVYWINNGYVIFKMVEIFDSNDEYYIIHSDSAYGISKYDNIIYDSTTVKEDEIIY